MGFEEVLRYMTAVSEAVILMAGSGSRLRGSDDTLLKPLVPVRGRPLVCYTLDALAQSGIKKVHMVVGYESARLTAAVKQLAPPVALSFIENPEWEKQNGISVLAAAKHVDGHFLLSMSDIVFDKSIVDLLLRQPLDEQVNLAVDRKIDSIFDLDDAMKVDTRGDRVVAIAKNLRDYNAIDTGLFVCPSGIFAYLERAIKNADCGLADGVRLMAAEEKVRAVDIGDAWWQDVDNDAMLARAEEELLLRSRRN